MTEQPAEIIRGEGLIEMLSELADTRKLCTLEILRTDRSWLTLLLEVMKGKDRPYLLVDKVPGFERAISFSPDREISVTFFGKDGVSCRFKTRVIECHRGGIVAELPSSIQRIQKRAFFRLEALSRTEVTFERGRKERVSASVKDYGLGGAAFFLERHVEMDVGDEVLNIHLSIPRKKDTLSLRIPSGVVRRIDRNAPGKVICALEFIEIPEETREQLWRHLVEEQRWTIRKAKRI